MDFFLLNFALIVIFVCCIKNDFTTVSSKGCSVVDYCIVSELINTFWRDINKLGVAQFNKIQIPMDQDGNVNYD